jgi:hypothetical protein
MRGIVGVRCADEGSKMLGKSKSANVQNKLDNAAATVRTYLEAINHPRIVAAMVVNQGGMLLLPRLRCRGAGAGLPGGQRLLERVSRLARLR